MLKAFHKGKSTDKKTLERAAILSSALGIPTIVGQHSYNSKKSYVIMEHKGDGRNLAKVIKDTQKRDSSGFSLTGPRAQKKLELAMCKALARMHSFILFQNRPQFDIKPDNIIPVLDDKNEIIDLYFIDLDGAIGSETNFTYHYLSDDSMNHCIKLINSINSTESASGYIDYRLLGLTLAETIHAAIPDCITLENIDKKNQALEASPTRHMPSRMNGLFLLYKNLANAEDGDDAERIIGDSFGTESVQMETYKEEMRACRERYDTAMSNNAKTHTTPSRRT